MSGLLRFIVVLDDYKHPPQLTCLSNGQFGQEELVYLTSLFIFATFFV